MTVVTLYLKKKELLDIVSGKVNLYDREATEDMNITFLSLPDGFIEDGKTDDEISDAFELRTDIEGINFQCGRNQSDGYALVKCKDVSIMEYIDEAKKPCGIFGYFISLGQVLKTNLS
jgi:hypothetical protein